MRVSSTLPPGFGFDPTELGTHDSLAGLSQNNPDRIPADIIDVPSGNADDRPVPTLWIGRDGEEEDVAETPGRSPGSILVITVCIGLVLATAAYVLDLPLS